MTWEEIHDTIGDPQRSGELRYEITPNTQTSMTRYVYIDYYVYDGADGSKLYLEYRIRYGDGSVKAPWFFIDLIPAEGNGDTTT